MFFFCQVPGRRGYSVLGSLRAIAGAAHRHFIAPPWALGGGRLRAGGAFSGGGRAAVMLVAHLAGQRTQLVLRDIHWSRFGPPFKLTGLAMSFNIKRGWFRGSAGARCRRFSSRVVPLRRMGMSLDQSHE